MKPRQPRGRFLGPNGIRYKPMRPLPTVADEPAAVDRIRDASTIRDEPECISPAILDSYAESNAFRYAQQHVADVLAAQRTRHRLSAEDRLLDLRRRAKASHVDLSHELHILDRELRGARAKGQAPKHRTLDRLTRLEGLMDGTELAA